LSGRKTFVAGCLTGTILGTVLLVVAAVLGTLLFQEPLLRIMAARHEAQLQGPPLGADADYDWQVIGLAGETLAMETFQGQPLFLHFWSPGCLTCIAEVPSLNRLHAQLEGSGVAMVSVVTGEAEATVEAAERLGVQFPVYLLSDMRPEVFAARGNPATFVIAPGGEIVYRQIGAAAWDTPEVVRFLESLVRPPA